MPPRVDERSFYVRLHLRREDLSETLSLLQRRCSRVSDFGIGTAVAPEDYWIEVRQVCAGAGEMLVHLTSIGVTRDSIRECREIENGAGHLFARQLSFL